jgi:hypothetical protein
MIHATLPGRAANPPQIDLNKLARDALQPWATAYESWRSGVAEWVRPVPPTQGCDCPSCRADPCACRCCVSDCDLLVEARVGERRIIPVRIENHWRRERPIELELSSWTKITDDVEVRGQVLTETTFTLPPCGVVHSVIGVNVGPGDRGVASDTRKGASTLEGGQGNEDQRLLPDLDNCGVSYADLRIKGCDLRSIRIAVAVLPRDCDAYVVDCACGCC